MQNRCKQVVGIIVILFSLGCDKAQNSEEVFTIYLVRHAEKELSAENPKDPALTNCGQHRAEHLARFLEAVELDAIYSTDYVRTMNTAQPTANSKGIEVEMYNPGKLGDFANELIERKGDALVVGHSNTTPILAGLLVGEELTPFDESIYNRIYQVVIHEKSGRLHILHSAFTCNK